MRAAGNKAAAGFQAFEKRMGAAFDAGASGGAAGTSEPTGDAAGGDSRAGPGAGSAARGADSAQPAWAKRLHRRQQLGHAAGTAANALRGGDGGGSSQGPSLSDPDE